MMKGETTNEKLILKAAEEEFISKGYNGAKTTSIAQKAGVTHAMLHYYFRTKENLFQKVFQQKIQMIADSFESTFDETLPFEKIISDFIERHFDFLMENPGLVNFVQSEIIANKDNVIVLRNILLSKVNNLFNRFEKILKQEVLKGNIKAVAPVQLLTNIISLNLSANVFYSLTGQLGLYKNPKQIQNLLKKKKKDNVRYILYSLKP